MFTVTEKIFLKKGGIRLFCPSLAAVVPEGLPGNGGNVWAQQRWRSMRKSKLLEEELSGNVWLYLHFICNL